MGTIKQIEFLARAIVNRLEDRGLVEFGDAEVGIQIGGRLIKTIGEREPSNGELAEEMRRVAAERNFVL